MLVVILLLLILVVGLVGYLVFSFNQLFPSCKPPEITLGNGETYRFVPFSNRNLLAVCMNKYLVDINDTGYVYSSDPPNPGVWTYDGKSLTNANGTAVGCVNCSIVEPVPLSCKPQWLYDGHTFYCANSFISDCSTVVAITEITHDGQIVLGKVPICQVGRPLPNPPLVVV